MSTDFDVTALSGLRRVGVIRKIWLSPSTSLSTLKPIIYGLAFEDGLAHPESLIDDRPTGFGSYAPQNFDGFHRGTVTVRQALTQSLNVPAVIVLDAVGPAQLIARMKRAGIAPVLPDQSRSLAEVLAKTGQPDAAQAALRDALRTGPYDDAAWDLAGRMLAEKGEIHRHED